MRADARRNYDRLVEAFTRYGAKTSPECIAKSAGVGIGTLYRHFPTRQALLGAVLDDAGSPSRSAADPGSGPSAFS